MKRTRILGALTVVTFALLLGACDVDEPVGITDEPRPWFGGKADGTITESSACKGPSSAMEYVKVCGPTKGGKVCRCISRLVMGTDHLGNFWEQWGFPESNNKTPHWQLKTNARKMLDLAVSKGINLFDTAPIYVGGIENTLGTWVRERQQKDHNLKLYTLTKGGFPFDKGPGTYSSKLHGNKKQIIKNVAEELRYSYPNLHGKIDFYLMHRDDIEFANYVDRTYGNGYGQTRVQTPVQTILEALSDDAKHGDVGHLNGRSMRDHYTWIGVSNWKTSRVNQAVQTAKSNTSLLPPMINSPYFSLFEMSPTVTIHSGGIQVKHKEMMDPTFQKGILIMPYSALGGFPIIDKGTAAKGGKDAWENAKKVAKSLDNNNDRYWGNVYEAVFTKANEGRFYRVHKISQQFRLDNKQYTIDQWLNAYVLAHPRTDLLAVGPIKKEHIDRTADAIVLAKALRKRPDILAWLYSGKLDELHKIPSLSNPKMTRTVLFLYGLTKPGQDMFLRGGIDHAYAQKHLGKTCTAHNKLCAMPIRHLSIVKDDARTKDYFLDWYGAESGQGGAQGSPAAWTTNKWPSSWGQRRTVAKDGYGETPLNTYGHHYWMLDVMMDCSKGVSGWFEFKSYISNGPGWEGSMSQPNAPYQSWNHFARCGYINVFRRNQSHPVEIKSFPTP